MKKLNPNLRKKESADEARVKKKVKLQEKLIVQLF